MFTVRMDTARVKTHLVHTVVNEVD